MAPPVTPMKAATAARLRDIVHLPCEARPASLPGAEASMPLIVRTPVGQRASGDEWPARIPVAKRIVAWT